MTHDTTLLIQYIIIIHLSSYNVRGVGVGVAYIKILTLHVNFYRLTDH